MTPPNSEQSSLDGGRTTHVRAFRDKRQASLFKSPFHAVEAGTAEWRVRGANPQLFDSVQLLAIAYKCLRCSRATARARTRVVWISLSQSFLHSCDPTVDGERMAENAVSHRTG